MHHPHQPHPSALTSQAWDRPSHLGFTWMCLSQFASFIFTIWLCVTVFELEGSLFIVMMCEMVGALIAGAIVQERIESLLSSRPTLTISGWELRYGSKLIDLRQPHKARVVFEPEHGWLTIDIRQGKLDVGFRVLKAPLNEVARVMNNLEQGPSPTPPTVRLESISWKEVQPFTCALLAALRQYATGPSDASDLLPREPGILRCLTVGTVFIVSIALVPTLLACFDWMPLLGAFTAIVYLIVWVWQPLTKQLGSGPASLAGWLAVGLAATGVWFTSNYLVWEYGDAVRPADLGTFGSHHLSLRPKRIRGLKVRTEWGTPWNREHYQGTWWYNAAVAITAADAERSEPVKLWALCSTSFKEQLQTLVRDRAKQQKELDQKFFRYLNKDCKQQWQQTVALPLSESDTADFTQLIIAGAKQKGLKADSVRRLVYLIPSREVGARPKERISAIALAATMFGWLFGAILVRASIRRKRKKARAQ